MTNYEPKLRAQYEAALAMQNDGSILQVLGWTLLGFDSIPLVWIWVGWRLGSEFWWWMVFGLACLGAALLAVGERDRQRASENLAAAAEAIRGWALAMQSKEQPDQGIEPRAA